MSAIIRGEATLWRTVIYVALEDAISTCPRGSVKKGREEIKDEARDWFRQASEDFHEVCGLAGMEPEAVRDCALRVIEAFENGASKKDLLQCNTMKYVGARHARTKI